MEYSADKKNNDITILPSLLRTYSMIQIRFRYDSEPDNEIYMKIIAIKCSNCGQ